MNPPLTGIRVLDFSRVLSGPFASMTLADMGADVVKIEHPLRPDETRTFAPPFCDGTSAYFLSTNRGKRSISLDLKTPEGRDTARALAQKADVVLENFRPGVMARLGLGADSLRTDNPRLVYCAISGFGQDSARPGYDLILQGMGGIVSLIGPPQGGPYKVATSIADLVASQNATQAIIAALFRREQTGQGATIDVSMLDSQRSMLVYQASNWLNADTEPQRMGNAHSSLCPYATFQSMDGWLNIGVANDRQWAALCKAIGKPAWIADPRMATNPARVEHRDVLEPQLQAIFLTQTCAAWLEKFDEAGVPAGPIQTIPEVLAGADLVTHEHPTGGRPVRTVPLPFRMSDAPRATPRRAPRVGEHTEEVLEEWLS